jgi:hypothetical protein
MSGSIQQRIALLKATSPELDSRSTSPPPSIIPSSAIRTTSPPPLPNGFIRPAATLIASPRGAVPPPLPSNAISPSNAKRKVPPPPPTAISPSSAATGRGVSANKGPPPLASTIAASPFINNDNKPSATHSQPRALVPPADKRWPPSAPTTATSAAPGYSSSTLPLPRSSPPPPPASGAGRSKVHAFAHTLPSPPPSQAVSPPPAWTRALSPPPGHAGVPSPANRALSPPPGRAGVSTAAARALSPPPLPTHPPPAVPSVAAAHSVSPTSSIIRAKSPPPPLPSSLPTAPLSPRLQKPVRHAPPPPPMQLAHTSDNNNTSARTFPPPPPVSVDKSESPISTSSDWSVVSNPPSATTPLSSPSSPQMGEMVSTARLLPPPPPPNSTGSSTAASSASSSSSSLWPPPPPTSARKQRLSFLSPANTSLLPPDAAGVNSTSEDTSVSYSSSASASSASASAAAPVPSLPPRLRQKGAVAPPKLPPPLSTLVLSQNDDGSTTRPVSRAPNGDTISLTDALTAAIQDESYYSPPTSRAERISLSLNRSARAKTFLQEEGEPFQRHPDYDFAVPSSMSEDGQSLLDTPEQREKELFMDRYAYKQEQHASLWKNNIGWLPTAGSSAALEDPYGILFRERLLKKAKPLFKAGGIPASYRGLVWEILAGARKERMIHPEYYKNCIQQLSTHATKSTRDIEKDVARTMHGHAKFKDLQGSGQESLKRGLCAFSFRNPTIGYAQSMSTILAGILLHFSSEEHAFYLFDKLLMEILPLDYYSPSMLGVKTDCAVLSRLVKKRLPKLHSHLFRYRIDISLISLPWFLCLYIHTLPLHSAMRVWDALFFKGSHILLSVACALLSKYEDDICNKKDITDLLQYMQSIGKNEWDIDTLMNSALGKNHVTRREATAWREEVREELEKEYLKQIQFKK